MPTSTRPSAGGATPTTRARSRPPWPPMDGGARAHRRLGAAAGGAGPGGRQSPGAAGDAQPHRQPRALERSLLGGPAAGPPRLGGSSAPGAGGPGAAGALGHPRRGGPGVAGGGGRGPARRGAGPAHPERPRRSAGPAGPACGWRSATAAASTSTSTSAAAAAPWGCAVCCGFWGAGRPVPITCCHLAASACCRRRGCGGWRIAWPRPAGGGGASLHQPLAAGPAPGCTPRWRPQAPVRQLQAAGVSVAIGGDNVQDPWFPGGDFDPIETLRFSVVASHQAPLAAPGTGPLHHRGGPIAAAALGRGAAAGFPRRPGGAGGLQLEWGCWPAPPAAGFCGPGAGWIRWSRGRRSVPWPPWGHEHVPSLHRRPGPCGPAPPLRPRSGGGPGGGPGPPPSHPAAGGSPAGGGGGRGRAARAAAPLPATTTTIRRCCCRCWRRAAPSWPCGFQRWRT